MTKALMASAHAVATVWNEAINGPEYSPRFRCRTVGCDSVDRTNSRLAYVSLVSDLACFGPMTFTWFAVGERRVSPISPEEVAARLMYREVLGVVCGGDEPAVVPAGVPAAFASDEFLGAQADARRRRMLVKNLLLQAGLEEVSTPRGASRATIDLLREVWQPEHAFTVDVASEIAQGAARQRYVDRHHKEHSRIRLTGLEQTLFSLGIRSNVLLTL